MTFPYIYNPEGVFYTDYDAISDSNLYGNWDNPISDSNLYGNNNLFSGGLDSLFSIYPGNTPTSSGSAGTPTSDLFNLGGTAGPSTRTVEGKGIFTDLNSNLVADPGEKYDPSSSIWNGWMSAQNAMQTPTTPTTEGTGYVPTTQEQQDYQNAFTLSNYNDTPLTEEKPDSVSVPDNSIFSIYQF